MRRRPGARHRGDVLESLLHTEIEGHLFTEAEITAIAHNWTIGELGTLAFGLGTLIHHLATHPVLQIQLRTRHARIPAAIDEVLRISGPLLMSRRIAVHETVLHNRVMAAGEPVSLMWVAANRDEDVFEEPEAVRLARDQRDSLLFGTGIHACPGADLARLEFRVALEELFAGCPQFELDEERPPKHARYPVNGYRELPLVCRQH